ncbi:MAG: hypothetical protein GXW85_05445 [Clostridia bacterium]|nr:hypothetical protein [Clostridia bacterium]
MLASFFSGTLAAIAAWFINRWLVNRWGDLAVMGMVPIIEEVLKTYAAILLGASIFYAHFAFGFLEAIWDMKVNSNGFLPAVFSLVTHSFFGFLTIIIYNLSGFFTLGICLSIIVHGLWNSYIIRISKGRKLKMG